MIRKRFCHFYTVTHRLHQGTYEVPHRHLELAPKIGRWPNAKPKGPAEIKIEIKDLDKLCK
jgi:hypothetical protein